MVQSFEREDGDRALAVELRGDDACDLGAVAEIVVDIVVVGDEVPAASIVNEAVGVIVVTSRAGFFRLVEPEMMLERAMPQVNAGINHGDDG